MYIYIYYIIYQPGVPKVEKKTSLYVGKIPEGLDDVHIKAILEVQQHHLTTPTRRTLSNTHT